MDDPVELKKFYANTDFSKASPSELKNMTCGLYITGDVENALKVLAKNPKPRKGSLYNLASLLVMTKNYEKATELIESGLKRCADSPMFLQLFQILKAEVTAVSNPEQAIEMYTNLLDNEKVHPYCAQIAASNFSALTLDSNVHLAKKKMSLYDNNEQYGSYRRSEIESYLINRFLILHKIGQPGKVKALIDFAKKQSKIDPLIPETFERTVDPSNSELTKYSVLFEAQNLISQSKFIEAADILASSPLNKAPRTITVVSELYVAAQQPQKAIEFLTKSDNGSAPFLDFAARFAYQIGFYEQGAKWAEKLVKATNNSQRAIAIHSLCLSMTDIEMAERYAQRIKIDSVSESELDALEETQISKESTASSNADSLQTVDDSLFSGEKKKGKKLMENMSPEKIKKLKEKKKKRRRLQKPANYDPQRHMDPERWIKLKKRTGAKKGGKKPAASASNTQNAAQQQQKKQQKKKGKRGKNVW
ncbi:hypothetical protein TRFO_32225 [Tritrichomonas foetus]|uniref:Signal recognition particle subunit SRP72 n=1 Tax=Tritrichomonas foetus TaxID=1144522 RepID=A0A1J4JP75_9EUKA|nr:hypothetical protein TRFO_32225 [Tritrichomonas foetus]|eukprot:OHT00929.1 hypothetical protein TRFO_32225 [Tritrichomonas foetus]